MMARSVLNPADAPYDRASTNDIAQLPAASRNAFPDATPISALSFSSSGAPVASIDADSIGDFTASTDMLYTTPEFFSTVNHLPTATSVAGSLTTTTSSPSRPTAAVFTGAAASAGRPMGVAAGLAAVAGAVAFV